MIRAVAYCRFSSEKQRDGYSIEAQADAIRAYCKDKGYDLGEVYVDEARSGTNDERANFQRMISDARLGGFQVLVVHKLDRFSRNRYDFAIYKKLLADSGVRVESVVERIDPNSPESILLESTIEGLAEFYSANLSRETKKGLYERASKGFVSGVVPLGYRRTDDGRFAEDPDTAPVVREIFSRLAFGERFSDVLRALVERGVRGRHGAVMSHQALEKLVANPIYVGDYRYGSKVFSDAVPALIGRDEFALANRSMAEHVSPHFPKHRAEDYPLTGIAFCAACGSRMTGHSVLDAHGVRHSYYRCIGSTHKSCGAPMIGKELLEQSVLDALQSLFCKRSAVLDDLCDRLNAREKERRASGDAPRWHREILSLTSKRDRLLDAYLKGALDLEAYKKKDLELEADLAKAQASYKAASAASLPKIKPDLLRASFLFYFEKYGKSADPKDRAVLFQMFVSRIEVSRDGFTVKWRLLPPVCENSTSGALSCRSRTTAPRPIGIVTVDYSVPGWFAGSVSLGSVKNYSLSFCA